MRPAAPARSLALPAAVPLPDGAGCFPAGRAGAPAGPRPFLAGPRQAPQPAAGTPRAGRHPPSAAFPGAPGADQPPFPLQHPGIGARQGAVCRRIRNFRYDRSARQLFPLPDQQPQPDCHHRKRAGKHPHLFPHPAVPVRRQVPAGNLFRYRPARNPAVHPAQADPPAAGRKCDHARPGSPPGGRRRLDPYDRHSPPPDHPNPRQRLRDPARPAAPPEQRAVRTAPHGGRAGPQAHRHPQRQPAHRACVRQGLWHPAVQHRIGRHRCDADHPTLYARRPARRAAAAPGRDGLPCALNCCGWKISA